MTSDLKWRTGFGWGLLSAFLIAFLLAVLLSGGTSYVAWAVTVLLGLLLFVQYRTWNTRGWPVVHYRAMLLYAHLAGLEAAKAEREGRPFDKFSACRELALRICGPGKESGVAIMMGSLREKKGVYLASLIRTHWRDLLPSSSEMAIDTLATELSRSEIGPQLVICHVVESTFGSLEAARYTVALVEGRAH